MNPTFARIRRLTLSYGGKYSSDTTPTWQDYQSAPLFCLGKILECATIPYVNNGDTLHRIISASPNVEVPDKILPDLVRKNVVLHESAHFCSDRILTSTFAPPRSRSEFVVRCLIAESFANTIEFLASVFADVRVHRLFFSMNSYISVSSIRTQLLQTGLLMCGLRNVMRLALITYLYLNSHESPVDGDFASVLIGLVLHEQELSVAEFQVLRLLIESGFTLNYTFRVQTTPLFFSLYRALDEFRSFSMQFTSPSQLSQGVMTMIDTLVSSTFLAQDEELHITRLKVKKTN